MTLYKNQKLWLDIIKYLKKLNFEVWSVDQLLKNNKTGQTYQLDIFFIRRVKYIKIIITGCAGFIGYHLTQKLSENKSYTISGIDSINNYYTTRIKKKG